ncbi:NAD(P)/FAD-dependent oxidoreductase [Alkalihalobacillus oceani]|uniref:NAD(P)/FAD-dependent oxidoreductase n=1 Tax=Halalkalibacter oceani TaxID=1653776 RepID=UPI00203BA122|nr:NAD(P)/FAD-dependent oxidoreductase [Halalkalibacter oceani]MCM3760288.1 NAD(P)/FAD-dependent oxidoreductase [Halalkalibacter oceani]
MSDAMLDVVIIGGGPGGLSAALVLGRARRTVALVDEGHPRNAITKRSHGFLTRDGAKPFELRQIAREQMEKYPTVRLHEDEAIDIVQEQNRFITKTSKGQILTSRKLIIATGLQEELPDIKGLSDVYGKSFFSCPYCDAWEFQDQPLVIIGNGRKLLAYARIIHNWSSDLVVCTNGAATISTEEKNELRRHSIPLVETPIRELIAHEGQLQKIVFQTEQLLERKAGFLLDTGAKQSTFLPEKLGIPLTEKGSFATQNHGKTEVDGVYVIGDAAKRFTGLMGAASEGYEAGIALNHELVEEDWHSSE